MCASLLKRLLLLVFISALSPLAVGAQSTEASGSSAQDVRIPRKRNPAKLIRGFEGFITSYLGIPAGSREYASVMSDFQSQLNGQPARVLHQGADEAAPVKPIKTLRLKGGKPLPTAQECEARQQRVIDTIPRPTQEQLDAVELPEINPVAPMMAAVNQYLEPPPEMPTCESSTFSKTELPEELRDSQFDRDMLVVAERYPFDLQEAFGRAHVILYTNQIGDITSLTMAKQGLNCLPFRLRVVHGTMYRFYGDRALYNFDRSVMGDPAPIVEQYLRNKRRSAT